MATGKRRNRTYEEDEAFWAFATIEVLRLTGIRDEELLELTHHSIIQYRLPSTGEVVPLLQIAPSKVELGGCARPYGSACQHEHACLRCPMLNINPKMLPRLDEIEDDLLARRARAQHEAWLGEVEGIDLTLTFLGQKRQETKRLARITPVELGMPAVAAPR